MQKLPDKTLLNIWEIGLQQHPIDRALTILAFANPETTYNVLASYPIGKRDRLLFDIRKQTFGPRLKSIAECSNCSERLEFQIDTTDLLKAENDEQKKYNENWKFNGYKIKFRLLNSQDLAAIAHYDDISSARKILIQQCIQKISKKEREVTIKYLPDTVVEAFADEIMKNDSLELLQYNINCPICSHVFQVTFDIVSFFWDEINAYAKRLLLEIHMLATAYGWTESEILNLSPSRRQLYVEMVT